MELVGTRKTVYVALRTLLAFVLALILGGIVFFAAGFNPVQVYKLIFLGAFGSGEAILTTLSYATPLIFTGLAFAFAQHAKVMNLGTEGQLYVGAMVAALIGGYLPPVRRMLCRYRRLSEQPVRRQYGHRHSDAKLCGPAVLQLSGQQCVCG